jgi:UDP-N-acetylmuramoyl-tripeptide--D-alanyl-D-alanine ligase
MSGYNQIQSLVRIAPPDVAVITKIAPAHMEYFQKGLEGIAEAKSEILGHPKTQLAILNKQVMDFEVFRGFKDRKFVHYSITDPTNVDYFLKKQGDSLHLYCESEEKVILAPLEESHFLENLLAAIAVARSFEVPWSAIFSSLKNLQSLEGRFERIEKGGVLFINDSYNANPESMKAALGSLPVPQKGSKRVAVLGCMVELGPQSDRYHYDIGLFASTCVDQLFCYGQNSLAIKEGFDQSGRPSMIFDSLIELHMFLKQNVSSGDVVLLKASNSVNLWNLMDM